MVIAHSNCGACHMNSQQMKELMLQRGIHQDVINTIRTHPLVPKDVNLHGYIIDSQTGKLTEVK